VQQYPVDGITTSLLKDTRLEPHKPSAMWPILKMQKEKKITKRNRDHIRTEVHSQLPVD